ncbi:MAG: DMT family transporter [Bryobacteraceae bacterium]
MSPSTETTLPQRARVPAWLLLSLLTVFLWGAWGLESKFIVERISPLANQVIFPLGFLPAMFCVLFSKNLGKGSNRKRGAVWAFLTGILGGVGNIAFYMALSRGGKAAIVVPLVGLAPLITVIMAAMFLKESITRPQIAGLVLAMISIYLLSI